MSKKKTYPLRRNFSPALLLPFTPYILGGVVIIGAGMYAKRYLESSPKITAIFSAPTIFAGGGTYLLAETMQVSTGMKAGLTLMGATIGWAVQYYALAPIEASMQQKRAEAEKAQHEADFRWYNPFSWAGVEA